MVEVRSLTRHEAESDPVVLERMIRVSSPTVDGVVVTLDFTEEQARGFVDLINRELDY